MKRKLINITQEYDVVCDNPKCDYKVANPTKEPSYNDEWLNKPCPKCGENLLTEKDWRAYRNFLRLVNFINKWFSWLTYILPKSKSEEKVSVGFKGGETFYNRADVVIGVKRDVDSNVEDFKVLKNRYLK